MFNIKKNLFAYLCLVMAVISLIFAIVCFSTDASRSSGSYESSQSYGGDAYTGIQNAAAQTANNIYAMNRNLVALTECVAKIGGLFFLLVAFTFVLVGVKNLGLFDGAPVAVEAAPAAPTGPEKLQALFQEYQSGAMTEEEFQAKRQEILKEF